MFQIIYNFLRVCVHTALHIRDPVFISSVVEDTFVMYQPLIVLFLEKLLHGSNIISGIGFISQRPEQDRRMILKAFKIGSGTVHYRFLPLRQGTGHIPGRFHSSHLLPGAVTLQIRLRHHIDSGFITQSVPFLAVRIMTGSDRIDMVTFEAFDVPFHVFQGNTPSGSCIPLMAVHTTDHQSLTIQLHYLILRIQRKITEAYFIWHHFRHFPLTVCQSDIQLI